MQGWGPLLAKAGSGYSRPCLHPHTGDPVRLPSWGGHPPPTHNPSAAPPEPRRCPFSFSPRETDEEEQRLQHLPHRWVLSVSTAVWWT